MVTDRAIKWTRINETNLFELIESKHYSKDQIRDLLNHTVLIIPEYVEGPKGYYTEVFSSDSSALQDLFETRGLAFSLVRDQRLKEPPIMGRPRGDAVLLPTLAFIGHQVAAFCNGLVANYIYNKYIRGTPKHKQPDYIKYEYLELGKSTKTLRYLKLEGSGSEVVKALKAQASTKKPPPKEIKKE